MLILLIKMEKCKMEKNEYMELMDEFFNVTEKIDDSWDEQQLVDFLIQQKTLVDNIAALTKNTVLFEKASDKYNEFKNEMFSKRTRNERVIFAYEQLLGKVAYAPTSLHMRSAIVLLMPLLSESFSE